MRIADDFDVDAIEERKEGIFSRVAKAASIVFVMAIVSGVLCGYSWYWMQFTAKSRVERDRAEEQLKDDSLEKANRRFKIGAAVGALLGLAYVVRCAARREEL